MSRKQLETSAQSCLSAYDRLGRVPLYLGVFSLILAVVALILLLVPTSVLNAGQQAPTAQVAEGLIGDVTRQAALHGCRALRERGPHAWPVRVWVGSIHLVVDNLARI